MMRLTVPFKLVAVMALAVIFLVIAFRRILQLRPLEVQVVCFEEMSNQEFTGLEIVKPIFGEVCRDKIYPVIHKEFNTDDLRSISECIEKYPSDLKTTDRDIGHKRQVYLTSNNSVIEIGGNTGSDTLEFLTLYHPLVYVILEPDRLLYSGLKQVFKTTRNLLIYNFGVGKRNEKSTMKGTSGCNSLIVNATEFFIRLGVGCNEYDLITINCKGCEYDLLEVILSTNLIKYFKHVQFHTYSNPATDPPIKRYCKLQARLAKTHDLSYSNKLQYEHWIRKDLTLNRLTH